MMNLTKPLWKFYVWYFSAIGEGKEGDNEAENKQEITSEFCKQLGFVIWGTKNGGDTLAQEWSSNLQLIVCGGGSYIKAYKDVMNEYERDILIKQLCYKGFKGYKDVVLPDSQYTHVSDEIDPKRLLVAQGLCFSTDFYDEIKKYYAETEIEDIPRMGKKENEEISPDPG